MMTSTQSSQTQTVSQRLTFLDNLRYLFVFGVVLQHASMAYIGPGWWPVNDGTSLLADYFGAFADSFLMPALFLIAGYFAIPSMTKKGLTGFLKGKLKRLGIPWLVIILTICPILPLIYHFTRDGLKLTTSYWETWLAVMGNAVKFDFGLLPPSSIVMQNDLFYQRYMWFLGLLLAFFFIFAGIYKAKKSWFDREFNYSERKETTVFSTLKLLVTIGLITFIGSFILIGAIQIFGSGGSGIEPWLTLGNIVQFRVSRIILHGTYFIVGVLAYKRKWIERGRFPGHLGTWTIALIIIAIGFYLTRHFMKHGPDETEEIFGMIMWFFLNLMTISCLGFFASLGIKYWNQPTKINQNLAANSYNMYLAHYIFVQVFQLLLLFVPAIPAEIKFLIVSGASLGFGYLACQYLIRPFPRLTVFLLIAGTIIMFLIIRV